MCEEHIMAPPTSGQDKTGADTAVVAPPISTGNSTPNAPMSPTADATQVGSASSSSRGDDGEMSPSLSSDSGRESTASTPETKSPHETRSATPHGTCHDHDDSAMETSSTQTPPTNDTASDDQKNTTTTTTDEQTTTTTTALGTSTSDQNYRVKIVAPNADPFELLVNGGELVQELHQVLLDRESTCHRTCFSLQLDGVALDHFTEWKNIEGIKDNVTIKVVEEPYTLREARIHLRHVRDLMRSLDTADAYNGQDGASLSYSATIAAAPASERRLRDRQLHGAIDCTPPDCVLPGSKERPLSMLHPINKELQPQLQCVKYLVVSGWNPPQGNRKLKGDVLYLVVNTLENRRYHITCCSRGFFVNQSTSDEFNPKPTNQKSIYHSLIDLLSHLSPLFKRNFSTIQKKRSQRQIFERLPTPYQIYTWTVPQTEPTLDHIRAEDGTQSHRLGLEDHIPGQTRDWNEELQTTHELPRKTLAERLTRERAIFKIHSDFVAAAVKGAMAVVDGNVMAINPADDPRTHMFIWNNIFFSLGFDVKDHYKELGGDAAAFVAPANDLQGVRAYASLDSDKLYTLGMVIIDYRGYRVTAQSIIPGILEREQEQSVVYGSVDFGKSVVVCDKYLELLEEPAKQLKILPHLVKNGKQGDEAKSVKLLSSFETKGIVGNDSRYYVLDLLRTFPPDVNYLAGAQVTEVCAANGYPRPFPHKLACLRHELIDAFVEARYLTFIRIAAFHLQQHRLLDAVSGNAAANRSIFDDDTSKEDTDDGAVKIVELKDTDTNTTTDDLDVRRHQPVPNANTTTADFGVSKVDGDRIADEIKKKLVSNVDERVREGSPTAACEHQDLPEAGEAKRIMEKHRANSSATPSDTNNHTGESCDSAVDVDGVAQNDDTPDPATAEIIRKTAQAVSSLSDKEFDIRFNPDCYCDIVKHDESEDIEKQRKLVREAAQFLLTHQIPQFVRDCLDHSHTPLDGCGLIDTMHTRGINVRYLGKIIQCLVDLPQLDYFKAICMCELLCRSAKHIFRTYLQSVGQPSMAAGVSHFLNCLLHTTHDCAAAPGTAPIRDQIVPDNQADSSDHPTVTMNGHVTAANNGNNNDSGTTAAAPIQQRRKSGKQRKSANASSNGASTAKSSTSLVAHDSSDWMSLTGDTLWQQLCNEMNTYYGYKVDCDCIETFVSNYDVQKIAILRRFSVICGVQLLCKDYQLETRGKQPFCDDDVMGVFPVTKHISPRASDASHLFHAGQAKIQQGQLRAGYDLIVESLNLLNGVYGAMHPEIAQCMRLLARLAYILGDPPEALSHQMKATQMSERCCGVDHAQTILEYVNLAHFSFANLQITSSLRMLYRARYLMLLVHSERHPLLAQIDSNIGVILYAVQEYDLALKFLEHSLRLHQHYTGKCSLKSALINHLIARAHSCRGDFRTALMFERETWSIYRNMLGETHEKTRESSECLVHLTQQAVTFQKRMNEASKADARASISHLLPIQIQQPSLSSILEVMNILNGIIFINLPNEPDDEKTEMDTKSSTKSTVADSSTMAETNGHDDTLAAQS